MVSTDSIVYENMVIRAIYALKDGALSDASIIAISLFSFALLLGIMATLLIFFAKRKKQKTKNNKKKHLPDTLTVRELEIAKLILEGKNKEEITEILIISKTTVKKHISNVLKKTRCSSQKDFVYQYKVENDE